MIRVVKKDGPYLKIPTLSSPWKMTVTLFSNCDTKTIYESNKEIIKSWLGFISELLVNLDEVGVFVNTTMWEDGEVEFSFNYTMTKLSQTIMSKEFLSPSTRWRWMSSGPVNRKSKVVNKPTIIGVKPFSKINTSGVIIKPKPIKPYELKKPTIIEPTNRQKVIEKLESYGVSPMRLLDLSDIKSIKLKEVKRIDDNIQDIVARITTGGSCRATFYCTRFIGVLIKKLMRIKYKKWGAIKIKIKAFIRLKSFFLSGFIKHGNVLYHKHSGSQYIIAGKETPPHLKMIDKAIKNKELKLGEVVKIIQRSDGQDIYSGGIQRRFTKYKNYKKPRVKIKKNNGESVESVYVIDPRVLSAVSSLTSQFWKAKNPINLNRRSKFADRVIKHCHIIYNSMDQVREPIELMNVCWRFIDSITIIRDVLFEFNIDSGKLIRDPDMNKKVKTHSHT